VNPDGKRHLLLHQPSGLIDIPFRLLPSFPREKGFIFGSDSWSRDDLRHGSPALSASCGAVAVRRPRYGR
jgi:hypothetical protein